jgi:hypothetical protein
MLVIEENYAKLHLTPGAIGVALDFTSEKLESNEVMSLCFICSHLEAHEGILPNQQRRIALYIQEQTSGPYIRNSSACSYPTHILQSTMLSSP